MKNAREVIHGSKFDEEFIYFQEQDKKAGGLDQRIIESETIGH